MALEPNFLLSWVFLCIAATISSTLFFFHKKPHRFTSKKLQQKKKKKKLPPGQMGLPWIGETMEFYKAQKSDRVFEDFVNPRIVKHGNLFKTRIMGSPTIVVNGAEANRLILSNEFNLVVSSWPSSSVQLMGMNCIMAKQGEKHRVLRGIVANSLSYNGLESLVPKLCDTIQSHLETEWRGKEEISLYRSAKALTFTVVFECLYGIKVELGMLDIFERVLEGVFALPVEFPFSRFARAKKARLEIETLLVEKVREKRREMEEKEEEEVERPNTTLFSRLVEGLIKGEITEEEVVDNMVLLVFAAHDTTSYAMAMTFKMLAQHPTCLDTLLQEHVQIKANKGEGESLTVEDVKKMKYSWQVVRETMRLSPPIFGSFRKAVVDIDYEGFTIPKGWKILWTTYGTHYNPEIFQDPMSFSPSRFDQPIQAYTYLPFGGGPRLCAGHQLAKMSILIFLHFVVTRYDWSLVHPDETISMDPLPFPSLGMPIKISPKVS
uniref:Taxadiene 5-alpha hydroxylase n=1 Tax=Noccaea caerulescens TaxID=107243 RepID=A0A1J3J344_NOCCA